MAEKMTVLTEHVCGCARLDCGQRAIGVVVSPTQEMNDGTLVQTIIHLCQEHLGLQQRARAT